MRKEENGTMDKSGEEIIEIKLMNWKNRARRL
jgi:hypothetical protein